MRRTPKKVYDEISMTRPPCERKAIFDDHVCDGRSTMEHVWIYGGKQMIEVWSIIRLCEWAHSVNKHQDGGGLNKEINEYISLMHATDSDFVKYPKKDWLNRKRYLIQKYGNKKKFY